MFTSFLREYRFHFCLEILIRNCLCTCMNCRLSACLFDYQFIFLFVRDFYMHVTLTIHLYLFNFPIVYLFIYLFIHLCICLFIWFLHTFSDHLLAKWVTEGGFNGSLKKYIPLRWTFKKQFFIIIFKLIFISFLRSYDDFDVLYSSF